MQLRGGEEVETLEIAFMFKVIFAGGLSGRKDLIVGKYDSIPEGAENIVCIGTCVHNLAKKRAQHRNDHVRNMF